MSQGFEESGTSRNASAIAEYDLNDIYFYNVQNLVRAKKH